MASPGDFPFLTGALPAWLTRRTLVLASRESIDPAQGGWAQALVVVDRGEIEIETFAGERLRLRAGAVLSFRHLALRRVSNPGGEGAVIVAIWKTPSDADSR